MSRDETRTATAHAPGSVTVVFTPTEDGEGSRGISFATADGVTARVQPATETQISLDGEVTTFEPVERVLQRLGVTAAVALDAATPVGAGFGASGAATLATALAANAVFGLGRSRESLVTAAHRAEVAAGTGLGDVFVQERGGLAYDVGDGRNSHDRTDSLQYVSHGGIATESVLSDEGAVERIRAAAGDVFDRFDPERPLDHLFADARAFADATGLVTDSVRATLDRVADAGGEATMAMVGETVIAVGAEETLPNATRISPDGARLLDYPDER